jgi:hypothetical protein
MRAKRDARPVEERLEDYGKTLSGFVQWNPSAVNPAVQIIAEAAGTIRELRRDLAGTVRQLNETRARRVGSWRVSP